MKVFQLFLAFSVVLSVGMADHFVDHPEGESLEANNTVEDENYTYYEDEGVVEYLARLNETGEPIYRNVSVEFWGATRANEAALNRTQDWLIENYVNLTGIRLGILDIETDEHFAVHVIYPDNGSRTGQPNYTYSEFREALPEEVNVTVETENSTFNSIIPVQSSKEIVYTTEENETQENNTENDSSSSQRSGNSSEQRNRSETTGNSSKENSSDLLSGKATEKPVNSDTGILERLIRFARSLLA
jgi:hypothetical protein